MTEETPQPEPGPEPAPEAEPAPQEPPPRRELRRSRGNRVIAGVCGGVAEFFDIDATLVRIAAVLLVFAGGAGLLLYLIGWLVMPEESAVQASAAGSTAAARPDDHTTRTAFGVILVVLGVAFLLDELDWFETRYLWPVALILVGLAVVARGRR